nr:Fic/DOC family N-terminal domain-containing protein [Canibacter zhuwentaonis]
MPQIPEAKLETRKVLKALPSARAILAELDRAAKQTVNPSLFISAVHLFEAQASSEIENIITTTDELFTAASQESTTVSTYTTAATKETLRYKEALTEGTEAIRQRPLTANAAKDICSTIYGYDVRIRDTPGIYIRDATRNTRRYTPPEGKAVIEQKLGDWEKFIHSANIDPLLIMAAAHYQFEAIHPFSDGNGRTGRIINLLILKEHELLSEPVLFLSKHIIKHKNRYYDLLLNVTKENDWESWLLFMLEAITVTAHDTLSTLDQAQELRNDYKEELRQTLSSGANEDLLDTIFRLPYCRIANVEQYCNVSRPTATKWLEVLTAEGILLKRKNGRENIYINREFMRILSRA